MTVAGSWSSTPEVLIVAGARHELDMAGVEAVLMEREDQLRGKR